MMQFAKALRFRSLFLVLVTLTITARADVLNGYELFPIFNQPATWEASLSTGNQIKDQGKFPYCGLYAMSSFLELWGDNTHSGYLFPMVDESYLSLAYNRVVGSPGMGTHPMWLAVTTAIFGSVPKGARFTGKGTWPMANWEKENLRLIDTKLADPLLTGKYAAGSGTFTGAEFNAKSIHIDLRNFYGLHTNYKETTQRRNILDQEEAQSAFRVGDIQATAKNMQLLAQKIGTDTRMGVVAPEKLYQAAKVQLYGHRPVYLGINAGLTVDKFRKYGVITNKELLPVGQGFAGPHAVVAVAHCDNQNSVDRLCARFNPYMKQRAVSECVAIQNSWGTAVHEKGYFCLAPDAWKRVVQAVLVDKSFVKTTN